MTQFTSAFSAWLTSHTNVTLRGLSKDSGIDQSMLTRIRKGAPITLSTLGKLLPVIERHSSLSHAITLHLAYLADETLERYKEAIQINARDADNNPQLDIYDQLGSEWAARARADHNYYAMWLGLDNYMNHPERQVIMFDPPAEDPASDVQQSLVTEKSDAEKALADIHKQLGAVNKKDSKAG